MKRTETPTAAATNLAPITGLSLLTLLGVIVSLVMLYGLHNKIQKTPEVETILVADEIGEIKLDKSMVRINFMKRNPGGKIEKLQEVELPLEQFASGYPRLKSFMDQMIEKGIITEQ